MNKRLRDKRDAGLKVEQHQSAQSVPESSDRHYIDPDELERRCLIERDRRAAMMAARGGDHSGTVKSKVYRLRVPKHKE